MKVKEKHVLVCWDYPPIRDKLGTCLRMNGFVVTQTGHGPEGLENLEKTPTSIVILGEDLCEISPLEMVYLIRSKYPAKRLPLLFISRQEISEEEILEFLSAGVSECCSQMDYMEIVKKAKMLMESIKK